MTQEELYHEVLELREQNMLLRAEVARLQDDMTRLYLAKKCSGSSEISMDNPYEGNLKPYYH